MFYQASYRLPLGWIGDTNVKFRLHKGGRRLAEPRCTIGFNELLPENINVSQFPTKLPAREYTPQTPPTGTFSLLGSLAM